jgi:hypothetical protein
MAALVTLQIRLEELTELGTVRPNGIGYNFATGDRRSGTTFQISAAAEIRVDLDNDELAPR